MLEVAAQNAVVDRTFSRYPTALECAKQTLELSDPDNLFHCCEETLSRLAGTLMNGQESPTERVRTCLMSASAEFAEMDCKVPRYEDWMSGSFESRLVSHFAAEEKPGDRSSNIFLSDLLGPTEGRTGADFAIFLEIDARFIVLLLQAKRTLQKPGSHFPEQVDIQRKPRNGAFDVLWQYRLLFAAQERHPTGLSAGYILYDNRDLANDVPSLPMIKNVSLISVSEVRKKKIDLSRDANDFASFAILELLQHGEDATSARLLSEIVTTVVQIEARRILVISADDSFRLRLHKAFGVSPQNTHKTFTRMSSHVPQTVPALDPKGLSQP